MLRRIGKWLAILLGLILLAVLAIVALHPRVALNMARAGGAGVTDVGDFRPAMEIGGCAATPLEPAAPGTLAAGTFEAMQRYSDAMDGVGLVVLVDGKLAGESYRPGADASTRAQSMSMHKSMVALLAGVAVQDGLLASADMPIGAQISEWRDDPRGKITLRQLLTQTSGLHNPSMAKMETSAFEMMLGEVTEATLTTPQEQAAGQFNYNNANFQLAGMAISRALQAKGGKSYAQYLSEKIWCPLGNDEALLWPEFDGGEPRYFAYLNATVRDWARVGELMRRKGEWNGKQLIDAGWIEAITRPSAANPNYGMGIWLGSPWAKARRYSKEVSLAVPQKEPFLAEDVFYFDGFGGQRVYVVPSAGLVISRSGEPRLDWDESVLVNIALRGLQG